MSDPVVIEQVREHYAGFARKALEQETGGCCGGSAVDADCCAIGDTIPTHAMAALRDDAP